MKSVILSVILVLVFTSSLYALDKNGLVLYLSFDEGEGEVAMDASGYGNDGQLIGSTEWVEGKFGTAVHISEPGDFVEVPTSDSLNIIEEITMEIWANVDSISADPYCSFITKCTAGEVGAYMLHVDGSTGQVVIDPLVFIDSSYGQWPSASGSAPFGEWHYFAASYDGSEYKTYIDGELVSTFQRNPGGELDQSEANVAIGQDNRYAIPGGRYMDCILDEARIWNRVLSDEEILEAMEGILLSVDPGGPLTATWGGIKVGF
jgi:hypothetical protein